MTPEASLAKLKSPLFSLSFVFHTLTMILVLHTQWFMTVAPKHLMQASGGPGQRLVTLQQQTVQKDLVVMIPYIIS